MALARFAPLLLSLVWLAPATRAQLNPSNEPIRVTVSQNDDGSRTSYQVDRANKRAEATMTDRAGKPLGKIRYTLDDSGRYATGEVLGKDSQFLYFTNYKYDAGGRLAEEIQLNKDKTMRLRMVFQYDRTGKQDGYSVYDAAGKLIGQTSKKR